MKNTTTPATVDGTKPRYTTTTEAEAWRLMRGRNARLPIGQELWVMVDGPEEGEASVLRLRDAVAAGFLYRWAR